MFVRISLPKSLEVSRDWILWKDINWQAGQGLCGVSLDDWYPCPEFDSEDPPDIYALGGI